MGREVIFLFFGKREGLAPARAPLLCLGMFNNGNNPPTTTRRCDIAWKAFGGIIAAMPIRSSNAYYAADVAALVGASPEEVIGALVTSSSFSVEPAQRDAWLLQITILQSALVGFDGTIFLEFVVPRIGSRLDVVLISGPAIFAIEFKVGESDYRRADVNQVWDYALDLKNFHKGSHDAPIISILVATEINPVHWFLNDADDTRSSWYLEDAATEFQIQGLELDWVCMTWDADLRYAQSDWSYNAFRGSKWTSVRKPDRQQYLRNTYRVLLTRARQGMVIFVPQGDGLDATRAPDYYDSTFAYLSGLGMPVL